jgi:hypothetical protein
MRSPLHRCLWTACLASALAGLLPGQVNRVTLAGMPTNLWWDNGAGVIVSASTSGTAILLMPLDSLPRFAAWEPAQSMDLSFGQGNWTQVGFQALRWAYLSPDACAHQAAAGQSTPLSLLTTDFDYGPYPGMPGNVGIPFAGATMYQGHPILSYIQGQGQSSWTFERWQLRTSGSFPAMPWNACPQTGLVSPNFTGFVAVEFALHFF